MLGAIIGDVIGSVYEWHNNKSTEFELFSRFTRFTDDTVLTVAIADAILNKIRHPWKLVDHFQSKKLYAQSLMQYARWHPNAGYGEKFEDWIKSGRFKPYRSYGNGSAMRVSPIGFAFSTLEEVLTESKRSAIVTHNHRHGIIGAQAVASAVFLARTNKSKQEIKQYIESRFKYDLSQKLDHIRPTYTFDTSCKGSVPQAIIAFLESDHFEDAIRKAISIGGDSDTIACITGGIAQAYYKKLPESIVSGVMLKLDIRFKQVLKLFNERFGIEY